MKIIVGLGNPGAKYAGTRHNVGFMVLDCLAARLDAAFSREKYQGLIATVVTQGEKLLLVKPLTFMNNSGDCVARAARNRVSSPDDLLVVADDVHLPVGKLRLRSSGSSGGHNGLRSVIERVGTDAFPRLRLGIGEDATRADLTQHVLGRFTKEERPAIEQMVEDGTDAVSCFLASGIGKAMNDFN